MIGERALAGLRCAAGLVSAVPQARLRIGEGDRLLLEVRRPPFSSDELRQVPACAFRASVARAWARHQAGQAQQFLDLRDDALLCVDIGMPAGQPVLAGGIVRATVDQHWVHVVCVALGVEACRDTMWTEELDGVCATGFADLGVTVLHAASPIDDDHASWCAHQAVERALALCSVAQIEEQLRVRWVSP